VILTATISNSANSSTYMSVAVSGATTIAASDATALIETRYLMGASAMYVITGLTAGSNTFTLQYRSTAGTTGTFVNRTIIVIPL
jgi:hypothetical protein